MTLEELLDCSPDILEKMSDDELLTHFAPYLNVTRPELAPKPVKSKGAVRPIDKVDHERAAKIAKGRERAAQFGFDMPDFS